MGTKKANTVARAGRTDWEALRREVIERTDVRWAYRELGVELEDRQDGRGWARVVGDTSAGVNVGMEEARGRYRDFGGDGFRGSLFDYAISRGKCEDYRAALRYYARAAGMKLPRNLEVDRADDHFEWQEWNDNLVAAFCHKKLPISVEAVKACGGRLAMFPIKVRRNSMIVFPVYGQNGADADPVGWTGFSRSKRFIELYQGTDRPIRRKTHTCKRPEGVAMGWVGRWGVELLAEAEFVWKVEGLTDMLAATTAMPRELRGRHVVITNADGCNGRVRRYHARSVLGKIVYVVHDADRPGQGIRDTAANGELHEPEGAKKWGSMLAVYAREVRNVRLPFELAEKDGKDLRDFFREGGTWEGLVRLAEAGEVIAAHPDGERVFDKREKPSAEQQYLNICRDLEIEVLGEWANGDIEIYSRYHGKTRRVRDFDRIKFSKLLQIVGPTAETKVLNVANDVTGMHRIGRVRDAVCFLAGRRELRDDGVLGFGCWRGKDDGLRETSEVVIVNSKAAAVYRGGSFQVIREPRHGGLCFRLGNDDPWCDFEKVGQLVHAARDKGWRAESLMAVEREMARWRWSKVSVPQLVASLIAATFIQSMWRWRPQVAITGQTNSGKSLLFETLEKLFNGLAANLSSSSTAKGIAQEIGHDSRVLLIDEWDRVWDKKGVLEMLRNAGRGRSYRATGTAAQTAKKTAIRVLAWTAGIASNLEDSADINRFIQMELLPAEKRSHGLLKVASEDDLYQLGARLMASAIVCAVEAVGLADDLKSFGVPGHHPRVVESYAVPAALASVIVGEGREYAEDLLESWLTDSEIIDVRPDEEQLFEEIFGAVVDAGRRLGRWNVETLVRMHLGYQPSVNLTERDMLDAGPALEQVGLSIRDEKDGSKALFIYIPWVRRRLLKGTKWEACSLATYLRRIPGFQESNRRLEGEQANGYSLPLSYVMGAILSRSIDSLLKTKRQPSEEPSSF